MAWRKSWANLNIFGKDGDGNCSKRKLAPDERSVLDDYLDLAEISPIRGKVCIANAIGYTQEQLGQILRTPVETLKVAEIKLVAMEIITIADDRVISIVNWKQYQSEYERQLPYRVTGRGDKKKLQVKVTKKHSISISPSISTSTLNDGYKNTWNEKMPWKITGVTKTRARHLGERLKEKDFVDNFAKILDKIVASDFLSGRKPSETHPNFKADFDWLISNDTNYAKILEGKYDNAAARSGLAKFEVPRK